MENTLNYRLIVCNTSGKEIKAKFYDCHNAKSVGGTVFHRDDIKYVCAVDITGFVYLYLVAGHPEKTINVSSSEAML